MGMGFRDIIDTIDITDIRPARQTAAFSSTKVTDICFELAEEVTSSFLNPMKMQCGPRPKPLRTLFEKLRVGRWFSWRIDGPTVEMQIEEPRL